MGRLQDFRAVLFGECTGNWTPPSSGAAGLRRAAGTEAAAGRWGPLQRRRGGRLLRPLYAAGAPAAVQAELRYDPNLLRVTGVRRGPAAGRASVAANASEPGVLRVALASANPIADGSAPLLFVMFEQRNGR